jgi:hypothetical protein
MISLPALAPYLQRKLETSSPAIRFRYFCLLMLGAQYQLGRENIFQTDCSGTVCWPLFCMGFNLRLTAAELFARAFTHHVDAALIRDYWEQVYAVFYERAGVVSHVTPIVGRGVIFDAVDPAQPAQLKALEPVYNWYREHGYGIYFRELEWLAVRKITESETARWEGQADEMLRELLETSAVGGSTGGRG